MKWLSMVLIVVSAICLAETAKKLSPDELKTLLDKKDICFLDVREPKELEDLGTIKGYVNIPLGQLESRYRELPKDKLIVTACNHGVRASRAAEILEKHGYKTAGACGILEWKEKITRWSIPKTARRGSAPRRLFSHFSKLRDGAA